MQKILAGLSLAVALCGCANLNSIYRNRTIIDDPNRSLRAITMDARQRSILASSGVDGLRVCAEQAPDVFAVLSASLSGQGSYGAGAAGPQVSAQIAAAMSEQASTIQRTQTVNLLAQSFYRTCERWLSGAIGKDEFIVQSMRDQRTMMVILAVEQLTGTIKTPTPVVISAGPASASNDAKTAQLLADAKKKADDSSADAATKQAAVDKALTDAPAPAAGGSKSCDDLSDAAKKTSCQKAKIDADAAKQASDRDEAYYQALLKSGGSNGSASAGTASATAAAAGPVAAPSAEAIGKVADAVKLIITQGLQFNEYDAVCSVTIRSGPGDTPSQRDAYSRCLDHYAPLPKPADAPPLVAVSGKPPKKARAAATVAASPNGQLSGRLFIQAASSAQRDAAQQFNPQLADLGLRTYPIQVVGSKAASSTEIRFYFPQDRAAASALSARLAGVFANAPACKLLTGYSSVTPGLLELWIKDGESVATPATLTPGTSGTGC